jgi:hypothetical protein
MAAGTTRIVRMHTGDDQRSHFEDLVLAMKDFHMGTLFNLKTELIPVKGVMFRECPLDATLDFHNPPLRQFVITMVTV